MSEKTNQSVYLEITSREDEKKWKKFLKHYFPNHYASKILGYDLVVENPFEIHPPKRIAVNVNGYGWIAMMIVCLSAKGSYIPVKDFDEFMQTDIYKQIVANGPTLEKGKPQCVHLRCSNDGTK